MDDSNSDLVFPRIDDGEPNFARLAETAPRRASTNRKVAPPAPD
jgi:hypothetical protein